MALTERHDNENHNIISFVNEISQIENISSCTHKVYPVSSKIKDTVAINTYESCSDIYILFHKHPVVSDMYQLSGKRGVLASFNKPLVFVLEDTAEYLAQRIQKFFPESRVMHLKR